MTKKQKIILCTVGVVAAVGLFILAWWLFGQLIASIVGGVLSLGGAKAMQQYVQAETTAQKEHQAADETYQGEVQSAQDEATRTTEQLRTNSETKQAEIKTSTKKAKATQEMSALVDGDIARVDADIEAWERLTKKDGFARVVFVAWLLAIAIVALLIAPHLSLAAPISDAHRADVLKLRRALQRCRTGGNKLAITLTRERKEHKAALKRCESKRKTDNKKCVKQKALLAKPPPVWPYVTGGIIGGLIAGSLLGIGLGYHFGSQAPGVKP